MTSVFALLGVDEDDYERASPFAIKKCLENFPKAAYLRPEKIEIFGVYKEPRETPFSYTFLIRTLADDDKYTYALYRFNSKYLFFNLQDYGRIICEESVVFLRYDVRYNYKGNAIFEQEKEIFESIKACRS